MEQKLMDLKPGDHLCHIYETEEEHRTLFTPFIRQGLERDEKVIYIIDAHTKNRILSYLRNDGIDTEAYIQKGQLVTCNADEVYIKDGCFDPLRTINLLKKGTTRALNDGYSALRVTGEATWSLKGFPGSQYLIDYEVQLNDFFPGSKCLAICQYDKRRFAPSILLDVLATHPAVVVGTEILDNFYYACPNDFQSSTLDNAKLDNCLNNLLQNKSSKNEDSNATFQEAQKIETIGTFAGSIAHDINNLLMGIQGRTSLAMLNSDSSHSSFEHLKGIEEYVMRASNLTQELLSFAKIGLQNVRLSDEPSEELDLPHEILEGNETILFVDDEDMIIHIGKAMLEKMGYSILTAKNGVEAVEIFEANKDQIGLVILDMIMPKMGGGEAYDRIKSINPNAQVLLSSGYSIEGEAQDILKRGCNDFIQKPFNIEQLSQIIREILDTN